MLARAQRLRSRRDYQRVWSARRQARGQFLTIRATDGHGTSRFGFIVSTKVDKRATVRNTIRRRLQHAVRQLGPLPRPLDVSITAQPASTAATYRQLAAELQSILLRSHAPRSR